MSNVDRAFIRAYSKQHTATEPAVAEPQAPVSSSPYSVPPPRNSIAPRNSAASQRAMEIPIAMWGAGAVVPQVAVPPVPVAQTQFAPTRTHDSHAEPHGYATQQSLPTGTVPESTTAKIYSAWSANAPAAPATTAQTKKVTPVPSLASGVEQLKANLAQIRTNQAQLAAMRIPPLPVPPLPAVETIDSFANLASHAELVVGNYQCLIDDFNPQALCTSAPVMSVELVQAPLELPASSPVPAPVAPATVATPASIQSSIPMSAPPASQPKLPAAEVLWEVDQFLYPALSDQLLSSYAYFSQAGEKLAKATAAGLKVLAITGVGRGEGRTTLAICLARAAAKAGLKVGLLDADFHSAELATQLGLEIEQGWEQVLSGNAALPEIAVRAIDDQVTLYPWVKQTKSKNPGFLESQVMHFLQQAADANQLLIIDLGPWSELKLSAPQHMPFDAAIVVQDLRHRKIDDVNPIAQWLQEAGVEAVGIAENFTTN